MNPQAMCKTVWTTLHFIHQSLCRAVPEWHKMPGWSWHVVPMYWRWNAQARNGGDASNLRWNPYWCIVAIFQVQKVIFQGLFLGFQVEIEMDVDVACVKVTFFCWEASCMFLFWFIPSASLFHCLWRRNAYGNIAEMVAENIASDCWTGLPSGTEKHPFSFNRTHNYSRSVSRLIQTKVLNLHP